MLKRVYRFLVLPILALLTLLSVVACQSSSDRISAVIQVGSKDFAEQLILGEMYALVLEKHGFPVERKLNLAGTPIAQANLERGEIDFYPEYTSTGLLTVLNLPYNPNSQNTDRQVYATVAREYREKFNLIWLEPSPMNNTYAFLVTRDTAQTYGMDSISAMVANASQLVAIGPPEFQERQEGLPGLKSVYGNFSFQEYRGVEPESIYQRLVNGEADVAVGFATDGEINRLNLLVLNDDKGFFPPYQVAPVVRQDTLEEYPGLDRILNSVTTTITTPIMQRLNYEVTGKGREPSEVAREFLVQQGLLEPTRDSRQRQAVEELTNAIQ
jgi:osmoprotectant transport system substrate-binding protein